MTWISKIRPLWQAGLTSKEISLLLSYDHACVRTAIHKLNGYVRPDARRRREEIARIEQERIELARKTPDRIFLTQGKISLVDADDFEFLIRSKWYAHCTDGRWYACRRRAEKMHRVILGAQDGIEVDHINGDGLDNRRINLRFATRNENAQNVKKTGARSKYKGVWPNGPGWCAMIGSADDRRYLGQYRTEEEAALAYDSAATRLYGEFAKLNFPDLSSYRRIGDNNAAEFVER